MNPSKCVVMEVCFYWSQSVTAVCHALISIATATTVHNFVLFITTASSRSVTVTGLSQQDCLQIVCFDCFKGRTCNISAAFRVNCKILVI